MFNVSIFFIKIVMTLIISIIILFMSILVDIIVTMLYLIAHFNINAILTFIAFLFIIIIFIDNFMIFFNSKNFPTLIPKK